MINVTITADDYSDLLAQLAGMFGKPMPAPAPLAASPRADAAPLAQSEGVEASILEDAGSFNGPPVRIEEPKKRRGRPKGSPAAPVSVETQPAPVPQAAATLAADTPAPSAETGVSPQAMTFEQFKAEGQTIANATEDGMLAAIPLVLSGFGLRRISEAKNRPELFAPILAKLRERAAKAA